MAKKVKKRIQRGQKEKQGSEQNVPAKAETLEDIVAEKEKKVCLHFDKGIDLATVTSKISSAEHIKCGYCRVGVYEKKANKIKDKQGKKKGGSSVDSKAQSKAIWVCLQCGSFYCGGIGFPTVPQSHAVLHAKQTHHQLAIQYENSRLRWCFPCDTLIPVEKSGGSGESNDPLSDIVKAIRGRRSTEKVSVNVENVWFGSGSILDEIKSESAPFGLEGASGYSIRGLVNLGNTCFFNSILQNLLVMDRLRDHYLVLEESVGPLTVSLKKIFIESISESGLRNLINPRAFFGSICAKAPQFRGYQQHDSHELLRCLLDGLCTEELSAKKRVSRENGTSANQEPTFVDAVFGGQLSSTVSCLDCGHSSKVFEPFLDLSLPVPTKRPPSIKAIKPISRAKKQKPPPKRNGRYRQKGSKDGSPSALSVPTSSVNFEPLAKPPRDAHDDSVGPYVVTETKISGSLDPMAGDEFEKNLLIEGADDFSWLDYLESDFLSNDNDTTSKCNDTAANHDTGVKDDGQTNESVQDGKESSNQVVDTVITTGLEPNFVSHEGDTTSTCNDIAAYCDSVEKDDGQTNKSVQDGMESSCHILEGFVATTGSENSTWLDFVESREVVDDQDIVSEVDDSLVHPASRGEITQAVSATQSICAESYCSHGNSFENEHPLQVQCSEVILLPYKEGSCSNGEILPGEGEVSSLAIGCDHPDSMGFDGFGDLFNELEIVEGPSAKPMSSESDPDEVDNSNSQVSVEGCLAYFIKPELLSTSEHGWNCDNCSKALQKRRSLSRKNHQKDAEQNGVEDRVNDSPPDSGLDSPCPRDVGNLSNGDIPQLVSSAVDYEDASSGNVSNIAVCSADELQHNESSGRLESEGNGAENVKVKRDATKSIFIDKAPSILTIHLKRFCQDGRGRLSKLNGHVDFKDTIDLRPYMDPRCQEMDEYKYRLSGVVVHSGSMRGGHYVAYIRGSKKSHVGDDSIWYHTSDAHVRKVSLQEVLNCEAYILFYEKV